MRPGRETSPKQRAADDWAVLEAVRPSEMPGCAYDCGAVIVIDSKAVTVNLNSPRVTHDTEGGQGTTPDDGSSVGEMASPEAAAWGAGRWPPPGDVALREDYRCSAAG